MGSHRVGHDWSDLAAAAAHLPKHHLHQNLEHGPIPQEALSLPFPIYLPKTMSLFWLLSMKVSSTYASAGAMLLQSCPSLCDPIDGSPPGSPVPGILQAKHWRGLPLPSPMHESEKWKWSHSVVSLWRPHGLQRTRPLCPWDFPGKSTGVGCHCLLYLPMLEKNRNRILQNILSGVWTLSFNFILEILPCFHKLPRIVFFYWWQYPISWMWCDIFTHC